MLKRERDERIGLGKNSLVQSHAESFEGLSVPHGSVESYSTSEWKNMFQSEITPISQRIRKKGIFLYTLING